MKYRFPAAIFSLALVTRLFYLWEISSSPGFSYPLIDAQRYFNEALKIASGDLAAGHLAYWQPPLYPYLLAMGVALFGTDHLLLHLGHFLLGAANCLLIYYLGRRIFSEGVARIASLAACLYGPFLYFEGEYLPPVLLVFLSLALLLLLLRAGERPARSVWFLTGLSSGFHIIARPDILLFLPLALAWLVARHLKSAPRSLLVSLIALFTAGMLAPVVPVALRNYAVEGVVVPVSYNGGINFFIGNNPEYDKTVGTRPGVEWLDLAMGPFLQHPATTAERSDFYFQKSFEWMREYPGEWLRLMARKIGMFWTGHEFVRNLDPYAMRDHSRLLSLLMWDRGVSFPLGLIFPLAILGFFFSLSRLRPEVGLLLLFTLASFWSVILFFVTSRYRIPLIPVLLLFAAWGSAEIFRSLKARRWSSFVPSLLAFCVLIFFCNQGASMTAGRDIAEDAYWRGSIATKKGDHRGARNYYREALLADSSNIQYHLDVGRSSLALGEVDEAERHFLWVTENAEGISAHGMLQAHKFLGQIYRQKGNYAGAALSYRAAIAIAPFKLDSRLMLTRTLIRQDMYDNAESELREIVAMDPSFAAAYVELGRVEARQNRYEASLEEFKRAIDLDPESEVARIHLANSLTRLGRYVEATHELRRVLATDPDNQTALSLLEKLGRIEGPLHPL